MLFAARFQLFQFGGPDFVVEIFAEEVEAQTEYQNHNEEYDALREIKDIEHRIHPLAREMFDDVNPNEVCAHEERQSGQCGFSRWILPECGAYFQNDEDDNIRVHHMIQPAARKAKRKFKISTIRITMVGARVAVFTLGRTHRMISAESIRGQSPSETKMKRQHWAPLGRQMQPANSPGIYALLMVSSERLRWYRRNRCTNKRWSRMLEWSAKKNSN